MNKKIVSILLTLAMIFTWIPVTASATEKEEVYISISFDGQYVLDKNDNAIAYVAVALDDLASIDLTEYGLGDYLYDADGDGEYEITALHLYIYTHEEIYGGDWSDVGVSGGAGSIFFESGLFGFTDCNLRYDYNGAYPAVDGWGLTADQIVLSNGDFLDIASYTSWSFYSDPATGFHYFADENGNITHSYSIESEKELQVKLVRTYSDMFLGGTAAVEEAGYEVSYGTAVGTATGTVTTDDSGWANITFPSAGTWYVWCDGGYGIENPNDIVSAPAYAEVTVTENLDKVYAGAVEEKIDSIGNVTIYDKTAIDEAGTAYDELSEEQKELVNNYETLVAAEEKLRELYAQAAEADHLAIYTATGKYINGLGTPTVGSVGGEWMVIDLTRGGYSCPEGYYENVVDYVKSKINDKEQLHRAKSTDNSRVILALTAAGYDVTDVDGHNLLMGLTDMTYVKKQGINGPIWALIAFDCYDYDIPTNPDATEQVTRDTLISYILEKQLEDGGWALSGTVADPDMTGMALQALAPYYATNAEVKAAVDEALILLSDRQHDNGGFGSIDGVCSESCAQVIVALTSLGINPETDNRFVKNGISVLDAMCLFAVEGGGFAHIPDGGLNGMATEQSQYALAAYFRLLNDQTTLYDMTDVTIDDGTTDDGTTDDGTTDDGTTDDGTTDDGTTDDGTAGDGTAGDGTTDDDATDDRNTGKVENATNEKENDFVGKLDILDTELSDKLLTKEEAELMESGTDISIKLTVNDIANSISDEEKILITNNIGKNTVGIYLDITLTKQIGADEPIEITKTNGKVTVTITVPEKLINTDSESIRIYKIVRVHEGKVDILDADFDAKTGKLSFKTDEFSTYALVYSDVLDANSGDEPSNELDNNTPQTGDDINIGIYLGAMLLASVVMGALLVAKSERKACK